MKPRFPFNALRPGSVFGRWPRCQLCKSKLGADRPGDHPAFPSKLEINAVGPFSICDDCVNLLDEALLK